MKKAFVETYKISKTFKAPLDYVFEWCTDFREDDGKMTGSKAKRVFLERTAKRIVWISEFKEKGKAKEGVRVVWLQPPNSWTLDTCGDQREIGEYNLTQKGKNKTRLDMKFQIGFESKDEVEDKKKWEKEVTDEWDIFGRHLENDYKDSLHHEQVTTLPAHHRIDLDTFHYKWNRSHKPVLSVAEGDEVTLEINDVWSWSIKKSWKSSDLSRLDLEKLYPLAGPIYVEGAKPGDALVVEVLDMKIGDFGWTIIMPGAGILEEFKEPYLYKWDLKDKRFASFENRIEDPLNPFCGVLGVAPKSHGSFDVAPPGKHTGNMDIRHLAKGSSVKMPVWVPGALFSAGDIHASMGDGEVCISAIECPGTAKLRFSVEKDAELRWPQYTTRGDKQAKKGYYAATGIAPDLMTATKESVRNMISYLSKTYDLTAEEAYILCSVAADVRVHEVVDKPNWVVGTMISQDIFP